METEKKYKIPDLSVCQKYIAEAEKIDLMPEEETDTISLDFDEETLEKLETVAKMWDVSIERVMQTMFIALVKENEE